MDKEATSRKSVTLPDTLWAEIAEFRFDQRIASEAEAIRRLLQLGLEAAQAKESDDGE